MKENEFLFYILVNLQNASKAMVIFKVVLHRMPTVLNICEGFSERSPKLVNWHGELRLTT